ncbi:hypothetical protein DICA4_F31032 [Diutina catenulata]
MLFKLLTSVIGVVYPVVGSYRAYESYTRVAKRIAATHFRVAGVTVPIGAIFTAKDASADDQQLLQSELITMQKWFIYWIVYACVETGEAVFFLRQLVPFYDLFKLLLSAWLLVPMVAKSSEVDSTTSFDETKQWAAFSENGAGLVYFGYIKPAISRGLDRVELPNTTQTVFSSFPGSSTAVDSSYVMVSSLRSRLMGSPPAEPAEDESVVEVEAPETPVAPAPKKGWLW